eukprot:TRINITY_DN39735_c0_g1_i1.p1 TRINITY_DN39735_c0_g1~~TRINITY_DN39735_c0_g1_i1.p1  ORF type:complete len:286 (+),score=57.70 TRINITY_DN39735_c0_g1_i1:57-860(+)
MEVTSADASKLLGLLGEEPTVTRWDARKLGQIRRTPTGMVVSKVIDDLGVRSGVAQGLPRAITSAALLCSSDHVLYILGAQRCAIGILKVGKKNLFIRDATSGLHEISPLCVLDIYVSEKFQRSGLGKILFEHMLEQHDVAPHQLGFDRPSNKLISFLAKHYALKDYVPQNNNYVVYDRYFRRDDVADEHQQQHQQQHHRPTRESVLPPIEPSDSRRSSMSQRHSSPTRPCQPSYNIITQQAAAAQQAREHSAPRTGKRLVRPTWAA